MAEDQTQRLYVEFDPARALTASDSDLYVPLAEVRGEEAGIGTRLSGKIRRSGGKPTHQVLAGHRGSGKTTELLRLKEKLEGDDPKMFVVFCQVDEDVDRNDVDFPDLLVAIMRQIARQVHERAEIKLAPGYFKDRFRRVKDFLAQEVKLESIGLEAGLTSLALSIKGSPDARREIRRLMEPDTGNLVKAANDVISEAVLSLRKKGFDGLVVLVDDLDKMVVRAHDDAGCSTAEYLFVHRAAQLTSFSCHVVYSMPISLAYSLQENAIRSSFGGHVPVVPMTKIATRPPEIKPHKPGIERFREIIAKRVRHAGAVEKDLFADDKARDRLIELSGGQPFELMTLVREAIITDELPIGEGSLDRALREGRREYARQLRSEHWPIIDNVRKSGQYMRTRETEPIFRELLESRAILQYVNDEEWYGVNPMVPIPKKPNASKAAKKR